MARLCRRPARQRPLLVSPAVTNYTTYHFHVDFATPANSTFTTFATPAGGGFYGALPHYPLLRSQSWESLQRTSSTVSAIA